MAHIIKLSLKKNNNDILVNLDQINVIVSDDDGRGSRIFFKKSLTDELVSQSVEEIYNIININNKVVLKG